MSEAKDEELIQAITNALVANRGVSHPEDVRYARQDAEIAYNAIREHSRVR